MGVKQYNAGRAVSRSLRLTLWSLKLAIGGLLTAPATHAETTVGELFSF